jgi:hypothetical protein
MINAEKYRDKLLKFIEKRDAGSFTFSKGKEGDFWQCGRRPCFECGMVKERSNCSLARLKWLLSEYKEPVKLTKFERDILEYALKNTDYRFITRDDEDKLYFYSVKPRKYNRYWQYLAQNQRRLLSDDLFPFVKWEDDEPTSIEDVLENCEVIEG